MNRRRGWVGLLVIGLLGWTVGIVAAQDGPGLAQPAVETVAAALPDILAQADAAGDSLLPLSAAQVFELRYGVETLDTFGFDTLSPLVAALFAPERPLPADPAPWTLALLRAGLAAHPADLSQDTAFEVGPLHVEAIAADFSGDGLPESLLHVAQGDLRMSFLAVADPESPGGYALSALPLPYTVLAGREYPGGMPTSSMPTGSMPTGTLETLRLDDLNADGRVEWAVMQTWSGPDGQCSRFYLLALEDGQMVNVAPWMGGCEEPGVTLHWSFDWPNVSLDMIDTSPWDCASYGGLMLKWIDGAWSTEHGGGFDGEIFECFQTGAENALLNGDLPGAAAEYESALAAGHRDPALLDYARARLALIDLLLGQAGAAADVLASGPASDGILAGFLRVVADAVAEEQEPYAVCRAAYDFIAEANAAAGGGYPFGRVAIGGVYLSENAPPDPVLAGCDPGLAVTALLARSPLTPDAALQDHLAALNIPVDRIEAVPDQAGRWQVWLAGLDRPLILQQGAEGYTRVAESASVEPRPTDPARLIARVGGLLADGRIADAQTVFETGAAELRAANPADSVRQALDYWQAVILEANGQPDAALAAYGALADAASDSAWGRLAALHLEPAA